MSPLQNPLGFGTSDYLEITFALLLLGAVLLRPLLEAAARHAARRPLWCMLGLAVLPVVLRLVLLPHHPVPTPGVYDEFGHLLVADTLRHFRLANPMHPMHRFFETFFVLQQPTYSSIYPLGQGLMLAAGRLFFGLPWAGVVFATAAFCLLSYWMLRAWVTPVWALLGGLLAVIEFGPLCSWMNSYWGGALAACAGCLVFGALPRLIASWRRRDAVVLGLGLAIHILTRPYESIFLLLSVVLFFIFARRLPLRTGLIVASFLIAAAGLTILQNRRVTGNWTMLPYQLSQVQYGVPAALTFQAPPAPHRELTPQQQLEYQSQLAFRNSNVETAGSYLQRLEYRVRFYRFFFIAPLYLALAAYLVAYRNAHWAWVLSTLILFALGTNFYPLFQAHYIAALTCLFLLMSVEGLRRLSDWRAGRQVAGLVVFFCAAHFAFGYTIELIEGARQPGRILVAHQLETIPGQLLIFVRYGPGHIFQDEWVYNQAGIDAARIVWARDRGPAENEELRRYYPRRVAWLLDPDAQPPKLSPYQPEPLPQVSAAPPPPASQNTNPETKQPKKPALRFEIVK